MGKRGDQKRAKQRDQKRAKQRDQKRAKQRARQLEESQRRRPGDRAQQRIPRPKPEPAAKQQSGSTGRKPKSMGSPNPKGPAGSMTPRKVSEAEYITIEWPPEEGAPQTAPSIQFSLKITEKITNRNTLEFKAIPAYDTVHPRQLGFDPPLQEYGKDGAKGFRYWWEKLDYVFGLPDPSAFPQIALQGEDRETVERFIQMCRRLASFSAINDDTRLSVGTDPGTAVWRVRVVNYPSDESFLGASAAFRQLHNDGEPASFTNAHNALFKVMKTLPEEQHTAIKETVPQWRAARGKLMNHTLQTLTAAKVANAALDKPLGYGNIKPDELIRTWRGPAHVACNRSTNRKQRERRMYAFVT